MTAATPDELARVFDLLGPLYRQTVRNIEQVLGLSRQFVQRCVNEAVEGEWVALRDNPAHRRSSLVAITDLGREMVDGIRAAEGELLVPVAAGMSHEDVQACARVLTELLDVVR